MREIKKDFTCILQDTKTGVDLLTFTAQQVGEPQYSASFVGGGVASGSQAFSIVTEAEYTYNPLQHAVIIDGYKWLLTSFYPTLRRRHGAGWATRPKKLYVLNLE